MKTLSHHELLHLHFSRDTERYRCARYIHQLQTVLRRELSRAEMLDRVERCRCQPGDVGREVSHVD